MSAVFIGETSGTGHPYLYGSIIGVARPKSPWRGIGTYPFLGWSLGRNSYDGFTMIKYVWSPSFMSFEVRELELWLLNATMYFGSDERRPISTNHADPYIASTMLIHTSLLSKPTKHADPSAFVYAEPFYISIPADPSYADPSCFIELYWSITLHHFIPISLRPKWYADPLDNYQCQSIYR